MRAALIILAACVLTGCASKADPRVTTVYVQVPVPCVDSAPERPQYRTGRGEYPGDVEATAILADDFEKAERYGTAWETAASGCVAGD